MKQELLDQVPGWYEMHFESPLDMLDQKPAEVNKGPAKYHDEIGGDEWTKCESYEEFKGLIRTGAAQLINSVMDKVDRLKVDRPLLESLITVSKRKRCMADAGDELDFDEWKRGNVDTCWHTTRRVFKEEKRNKAALLFINLTASWNITPEDLEWRTAAIIKITQTLAAAGYALEILVGSTSHQAFQEYGKNIGITFRAKPSTMPLSVERLILQTSAAWFRYCVFAALTANDRGFRIMPHYGYPAYGKIPPYIARMYGKGYKVIQIPGNAMSESAAQTAINSTIKEVQGHG